MTGGCPVDLDIFLVAVHSNQSDERGKSTSGMHSPSAFSRPGLGSSDPCEVNLDDLHLESATLHLAAPRLKPGTGRQAAALRVATLYQSTSLAMQQASVQPWNWCASTASMLSLAEIATSRPAGTGLNNIRGTLRSTPNLYPQTGLSYAVLCTTYAYIL